MTDQDEMVIEALAAEKRRVREFMDSYFQHYPNYVAILAKAVYGDTLDIPCQESPNGCCGVCEYCGQHHVRRGSERWTERCDVDYCHDCCHYCEED